MVIRSDIEADAVSPADHALEELAVSVDHLVKITDDGGLDGVDPRRLLDFALKVERSRNLLALVDHHVVAACTRSDAAHQLGARSVAALLASHLRISEIEAVRRVRAAEALVPIPRELNGRPVGSEPPTAAHPLLAEAQRSGDLSPEQVSVVERALSEVDRPGYTQQTTEQLERELVGKSVSLSPRELRKLAQTSIEAATPDGSRSSDALAADRRHLHLSSNADGSMTIIGRVVGTVAASLLAILNPLAKPRPDSPGHRGPDHEDTRTYGQRMHDALGDVCARALRAGGLPEAGGIPTTLIVTIDAEDLARRTGHGETSDGTLLSVPELLRLASETEIISAVLGTSGECLSLGRTRRIASRAQTYALIARDGGCSFPGCQHPPEWCDRHHIRPWIDGGLTELANLTLLCRYHHTHFASAGWDCRVNDDGVPEWSPPRWFDADRKPQVNQRILRRRLEVRVRSRNRRRRVVLASAVAGGEGLAPAGGQAVAPCGQEAVAPCGREGSPSPHQEEVRPWLQ